MDGHVTIYRRITYLLHSVHSAMGHCSINNTPTGNRNYSKISSDTSPSNVE